MVPPSNTRRVVAGGRVMAKFVLPSLERKARIGVRNQTYETRCHDKTVGDFFIDSGAHTLHNVYVVGRSGKEREQGYLKFDEPEFWTYVDRYAAFIKRYQAGIDYYANVDVILDPKRSWKVLKYLENEHGLSPVPVIHHGTSLKWVEKHLNAGYEFIGIGGFAKLASKSNYYDWADGVFNLICDNPRRLPCVRTHGFAVTRFKLLTRYPFWSCDSVSWAKMAGFGGIYVPHKRKGKYTFDVEPYAFQISDNSSTIKKSKVRKKTNPSAHFNSFSKGDKKIILDWIEYIGMELRPIQEWYPVRAEANLQFFQRLQDSLPDYPWPFTRRVRDRYLPELWELRQDG